MPQGDGATLRTHLERLQASTGKVDAQLHIDWPASGRAIWQVFNLLSHTRQAGMGVSGIAFTEIEAWQRLYHVNLTPWELEMIQQFDALALESVAKNN